MSDTIPTPLANDVWAWNEPQTETGDLLTRLVAAVETVAHRLDQQNQLLARIADELDGGDDDDGMIYPGSNR